MSPACGTITRARSYRMAAPSRAEGGLIERHCGGRSGSARSGPPTWPVNTSNRGTPQGGHCQQHVGSLQMGLLRAQASEERVRTLQSDRDRQGALLHACELAYMLRY